LNQEFNNQKLPVRQINHRQIDTTPTVKKEMEECVKKFWSFTCSEDVNRRFMDFLGTDGVLFFRLMELNSSTPVVNELLSQLLHDFVQSELE
jgi:hypothetical protein